MNCHHVRESLSEYVCGEVGDPVASQIAQHLCECAACRAELIEATRVEAALVSLARAESAPDLSSDLRRRIAGASRRRPARAWVALGVCSVAVAFAAMVWPTDYAPAPEQRSPKSPNLPGHGMVEPATPRAGVQVAGRTQPEETSVWTPACRRGREADSDAGPVHDSRRRPRSSPMRETAARSVRPDLAEHPARTSASLPSAMCAAPEAGGVAPEPAVAEHVTLASSDPLALTRTAQAAKGVILLLGQPEPVRPSGSYYAEVTSLDGTRTVLDQRVERDAAGQPQVVRIFCEQIAADAALARQGGRG